MIRTAIHRSPGLAEKVAQALMEEITSGGYAVGDWLPPEQALANRYGVSRTVLREAISQLKVEGLVRAHQGRGVMVISTQLPQTFVLPTSKGASIDAVLQIVELRIAIEAEAAGLAAARRTGQDLREMKTAIEQMARAIGAKDVALGIEADLRFHRALCEATKNPHYLSFYEFLSTYIRENITVSRQNSARGGQRSEAAQGEHTAIYDAIAAGDAERARSATRLHVENTAKRLAAISREKLTQPSPPESEPGSTAARGTSQPEAGTA